MRKFTGLNPMSLLLNADAGQSETSQEQADHMTYEPAPMNPQMALEPA